MNSVYRMDSSSINLFDSTARQPVEVDFRRILSRQAQYGLKIVKSLKPGKHSQGCFVWCNAPACCPLCSLCPCCGEADYVVMKREASKYVYIRENSLEWNEPQIVLKHGGCCGVDPCVFDVVDKVSVLYFDDPIFDNISDKTRFCNEFRSCVCGGHGERIQLDSTCCCGLMQRSAFPCPFVPVCCPNTICPYILRREIYVDDAQQGIYELQATIKSVRNNPLYKNRTIIKEDGLVYTQTSQKASLG